VPNVKGNDLDVDSGDMGTSGLLKQAGEHDLIVTTPVDNGWGRSIRDEEGHAKTTI
jgi:hypothetical protein